MNALFKKKRKPPISPVELRELIDSFEKGELPEVPGSINEVNAMCIASELYCRFALRDKKKADRYWKKQVVPNIV